MIIVVNSYLMDDNCCQKETKAFKHLYHIVTRDIPDGKRSLNINSKAQQSAWKEIFI